MDNLGTMRSSEYGEYEAFLSVAEAGSFVGGARAVGITPSAMSQIIRRLEERVGLQLLHRTTRSLSLTTEGERFVTRLRLGFAEIEAAARDLDERRATPSGVVRIIAPRIAWTDLIEPRLPALMARYPDIVPDIRIDEGAVDIVRGGYDVGFRLGEYIDPQTVAIPVGPMLRQIAVAAPGYLAVHGTPEHPRDLHRHRCIGWRPMPDADPYVWEFARDGVPVTVAIGAAALLSDREATVALARAGIGIALWVEHRLQPWIDRGELVPVLTEWSQPYAGFHAYYYRDRLMSPATRAFLSALRDVPSKRSIG